MMFCTISRWLFVKRVISRQTIYAILRGISSRGVLLSAVMSFLLAASGCDFRPRPSPVDTRPLLKKLHEGAVDSTQCHFWYAGRGEKWLTAEEHGKMVRLLKDTLSSPGNRAYKLADNHECAPEIMVAFVPETQGDSGESPPALSIRYYFHSILIVEILPDKQLGVEPLYFATTPEMYDRTKALTSEIGKTCSFPSAGEQ